jgi:hypothetical protein
MWMFLAHAALVVSAAPNTLADACSAAPPVDGEATAQLLLGSVPAAQVALDGVRLGISTPLVGRMTLEAVPGEHLVGLYAKGKHHVYRVTLAPGTNKVVLPSLGDVASIRGNATYLGVAPCWDKLKNGVARLARQPLEPPDPAYAGVRAELDKLTRARGLSEDDHDELEADLVELLDRFLPRPAARQERSTAAAPAQYPPVSTDKQARARKFLEEGNHAVLMGNHDEAVKAGESALAADPNLMDAHKLLGVAYARVQKVCAARTHYQAYLDSNPPSDGQKERIKVILQGPDMAACP